MLRSRWIQAVVVVTLAATPFLFTGRAHAIQDSEDKVLFGPVGIGVGQAARVNVYAVGNPNDSPWLFIVRVFSRTGELVREGKFEVAPGAIGSFDINLGAGGISVPDRLGRRTIRAEIVGFNPQPDPPGKYVATLEVYSSLTGHTSILIGNPDEIPAQPPPDPR